MWGDGGRGDFKGFGFVHVLSYLDNAAFWLSLEVLSHRVVSKFGMLFIYKSNR